MSSLSGLACRLLVQLAHHQQQAAAGTLLLPLVNALADQHRPSLAAIRALPRQPAQAAGARAFASRPRRDGTRDPAALYSFTKPFVEQILDKLQISRGSLSQLLDAPGTTDEDVIAWTLARLEEHPAQQLAAPLTAQLRSLREVVTARHEWQHHEVAHVLLLRQVASSADIDRLTALTAEEIRALPEYPSAAAAAASSTAGAKKGEEERVRAVLIQAARQGQLRLSPLESLRVPDFWERVADITAATADRAQLQNELKALGFVQAVQDAQQRSQVLMGLMRALNTMQQQRQQPGSGQVQSDDDATSAAASAEGSSSSSSRGSGGGDGGGNGRSATQDSSTAAATGQLERLLAHQLGCSSYSSDELLQRLLARVRPLTAVGGTLPAALAAASPVLVATLQQMPEQAAASATWQEVMSAARQQQDGGEAGPVEALTSELQRWRAAAAADGNVAVACSLSREEVHALTEQQFKALAAYIQAWESRGRLLAGAYLSGAGPDPTALSDSDRDALAWRLHKEPQLAAKLVAGVLRAAARAQGVSVVSNDEERDALKDAEAGFLVEQEVARLSPYGRPELLLSGVLTEDLPELLKGVRPQGAARAAAAVPKQLPAARIAADLVAWLSRDGASWSQALPSQWKEAAEKLAPSRKKLPSSLRGMFDDLLATDASGMSDAAAYAQFQDRIVAFLGALDNELGAEAAEDGTADGAGAGPGSGAGVPDGGPSSVNWRLGVDSAMNARSSKGLTELLGEEEGGQMMMRFGDGAEPWKRRGREEEGTLQPYEMLGELHHGMHMQRYLNAEFDPDRQLDLVHAPTGWQDPALFESSAVFLEGMRPLLDAHLTSQGERGLHDSEWQLYSGAALAEYEGFAEGQASAARRAGRSGFHNSRADEAYLKQRLEKGMPPNSPLRAAGAKYLAAACQNRSWSFAQRRHLVERILEIAAHLADQPARKHKGSPFSSLFVQDGPPLVPRLLRRPQGKGARVRAEPAQLPAGFGAGRRAGQRVQRKQQAAATAVGG